MFDLLMSADMMLADPDGMAELLDARLGVHRHPRWRQAFADHPYIAHFLRVNKSLAIAPTRIEPQWHLDRPNPGDPFFHDFLQGLVRFQGPHRPMTTHSLVLTLRTAKMERLIETLARRRLPFRLAQRTEAMDFDRLWLGVTPDRIEYQPTVDGGLCIEVMGLEPLQLPPETFANPPPQPVAPVPGEMIRVTARGFLVRDLDETLRRCSTNLDWEPDAPIEALNEEGYRRARMPFSLANSARLDVIEPTRWNGDAGRYLHTWGPGLYYIRISVHDLAAKAEDLRARQTPFTWVPAAQAVGGRPLIRVDPACVRGQLFEFEEG